MQSRSEILKINLAIYRWRESQIALNETASGLTPWMHLIHYQTLSIYSEIEII